jgi:hypothetical protein
MNATYASLIRLINFRLGRAQKNPSWAHTTRLQMAWHSALSCPWETASWEF